jgi:hypothetical protein
MKSKFLLMCVLLLATFQALAQDDDPDVLRVDAAEHLGPISPYIFGTAHGPWANVSAEMLPEAFESGVTFLRFPGGEWGDLNNIRPEHIDMFMLVAQGMNAEPHIAVRLKDGTPELAANLVRMVNIEKGHNVRYWAVGNEPDLFPDYSIELFNREWREIAQAMLEVDPDIILIGPDVSQYPPTLNSSQHLMRRREWVRAFLEANGDLVDIVSVHRYPFPQGQRIATIDDLRRNSAEWDTLIPDLRELAREVTGRDMPVAVTEINSHWSHAVGSEASPDSFYNAIWYADVLGRMIKNQVEITAHFTLALPGAGGGFGLLDRYNPRPTYYVFRMYRHFGSEQVAAESADPDVTIYAALRDDGALTLMVINLGPIEATKTLELEGLAPGGVAEVWRFDAEHDAERQLDDMELADGSLVTLPGQSLTLFIIPEMED